MWPFKISPSYFSSIIRCFQLSPELDFKGLSVLQGVYLKNPLVKTLHLIMKRRQQQACFMASALQLGGHCLMLPICAQRLDPLPFHYQLRLKWKLLSSVANINIGLSKRFIGIWVYPHPRMTLVILTIRLCGKTKHKSYLLLCGFFGSLLKNAVLWWWFLGIILQDMFILVRAFDKLGCCLDNNSAK